MGTVKAERDIIKPGNLSGSQEVFGEYPLCVRSGVVDSRSLSIIHGF